MRGRIHLDRDLREVGLRVEVNERGDKIGAKIRNAQLQKIPFMLVVGANEEQRELVNVRRHGGQEDGEMSVGEFARLLEEPG